MLPHLGPEIMAVVQAACSSAPNDSRSGPRKNHFGDGIVIHSEILQFEDCGCPQPLGPLAPLMHACPESAANLGPIGKFLVFIGVPSNRNGMIVPMYLVDECVDTLALVRFQQHLIMCEFPLAISNNTISKPRHAD